MAGSPANRQAGDQSAADPGAERGVVVGAAMMDGAPGPHGGVRGTQFFVGVMGEVWHRPSLSGLEILWRWAAGMPVLALAVWRIWTAAQWRLPAVKVEAAALQAMTVFQPVAALATLRGAWLAVFPIAKPVVVWLLPLAALLWLGMATLGRTVVLLRLDKSLCARRRTLLVLYALRGTLLLGVWALWVSVVWQASVIAISAPAARGSEPDLVAYSALLICGSLLVYVLWAVVNWPFQLAPLLAMQLNLGVGASLRTAMGSSRTGGKLIEVNLVMCIVKIAVLVLAMVFSSCPLPFADMESSAFLHLWLAVVTLLYLAALDYFHVVHTTAHLRLWRATH